MNPESNNNSHAIRRMLFVIDQNTADETIHRYSLFVIDQNTADEIIIQRYSFKFFLLLEYGELQIGCSWAKLVWHSGSQLSWHKKEY